MIKNIEDLKKCQVVCRNQKDIEDCLNMLEELGFEVRNNDNQYKVIFYREYSGIFENDIRLECEIDTYFFNKKFIKILKKLINEKEEKDKEKEKKEKIEDIEVASDGRIIKINNRDSQQKVYIIYGAEAEICNLGAMDKMIVFGLLYATKEARDRAMFKLEIETKLKNIAERLNNGWKIDWDKGGQHYHADSLRHQFRKERRPSEIQPEADSLARRSKSDCRQPVYGLYRLGRD